MSQQRILIVDDDPDMREALRLPLEAQGYDVFDVSSGKGALEYIAEVKPDLMILDVMMESDTAGFQTAYQIRNPPVGSRYSGFEKLPILILTAIGEEKKMAFSPDSDGAFLPVDAFLEKPVRPELLLQKVAQLLKQVKAA